MSTCTIPSNEARTVYPQARDDHEAELWARYMESRSDADRNALVEQYANLAHHHLHQLNRHNRLPGHLSSDDFSGVVFEALIRCVERFDPERGWQFTTFATCRIKGAIQDEMRSRSKAEGWNRLFGQVAQVQSVQAMEAATQNGDGESLHRLPDLLNDELASEDIELNEGEEAIRALVNLLDDREAELVRAYYLHGTPLRVIADRLGISESRASQVHGLALQRLADSPETLELLGLDSPPRHIPSRAAYRHRRNQGRSNGHGGPGQAVEQIDREGNVIATHASMRQAGKAIGMATAYISKAARDGSLVGGFYWCRPGEPSRRRKTPKPEPKPRPKPKPRDDGRPGHAPKPVVRLDDAGNVAERFESVTAAAEAIRRTKSNVRNACRQGYNAAGSQWRYLDEQGQPVPPSHPHTPKPGYVTPVEQVTDEGQVVGRFPSLAQASRETGLQSQSIANAVHREHRAGGFWWRRIGPVKHPRRQGEKVDD